MTDVLEFVFSCVAVIALASLPAAIVVGLMIRAGGRPDWDNTNVR